MAINSSFRIEIIIYDDDGKKREESIEITKVILKQINRCISEIKVSTGQRSDILKVIDLSATTKNDLIYGVFVFFEIPTQLLFLKAFK